MGKKVLKIPHSSFKGVGGSSDGALPAGGSEGQVLAKQSDDDGDADWVDPTGGGSDIDTTDDLPEGAVNKYFTASRVLSSILTGAGFTDANPVLATDSVLVAFGKLQKQITDFATVIYTHALSLTNNGFISINNNSNTLGSFFSAGGFKAITGNGTTVDGTANYTEFTKSLIAFRDLGLYWQEIRPSNEVLVGNATFKLPNKIGNQILATLDDISDPEDITDERILTTPLTGFTPSLIGGTEVTSSDTILVAFGRLAAKMTGWEEAFAVGVGTKWISVWGDDDSSIQVSKLDYSFVSVQDGDGFKAVVGPDPSDNFTRFGREKIETVFDDVSRPIVVPRKAGTMALLGDLDSVFTPADLTGVLAWIDPTDLSTVTFDAATNKVSLVKDKSSAGNDFAQATSGVQPTIDLSGGLNGKPCLVFGAGKYLGKTFGFPNPYTIYTMLVPTTLSNGDLIIDLGGGFVNGVYVKNSTVLTGKKYLGLCAGANWRDGSLIAKVSKWSLYRWSNDSSGNFINSVDNQPVMGEDHRFNYGAVGGDDATKFFFGESGGTGSFKVAECLVLDHVPTFDEDRQIRNYLLSKHVPVNDVPYYAFGDSNMQTFSVPEKVAVGLNANCFNFGLSGTDLAIGVNNLGTTNLLGLYKSLPLDAPGYLTFCYGANSNYGSTVPASYKAAYKHVIQYFIDKGFDRNKICIISLFHATTGAAWLGSVQVACQEISDELGIRFADCYTYGLTYDPSYITYMSGVHLTTAGADKMAELVLAALA